jgi:hypothetical protein
MIVLRFKPVFTSDPFLRIYAAHLMERTFFVMRLKKVCGIHLKFIRKNDIIQP